MKWFLLIALSFSCRQTTRAQNQELEFPALATIQNAWKQREDTVRSISCDWKVVEFLPKGKHGKLLVQMGRKIREPVPPKDTQHSLKSSILLHKEKFWSMQQVTQWRDDEQRFSITTEEAAFDGQYFRSVTKREDNDPRKSSGIVSKESAFRDAAFPQFRVLFNSIRGTNSELCTFRPLDFLATGRKRTIHNHPCYEFRSDRFDKGGERLVWICPNLDYQIVQEVIQSEKTKRIQTDIQYQLFSTPPILLPSRWTITEMSGDELIWSYQYEAEQYQVNQQVDDKKFEIVFPPGLTVRDETGIGVAVVQEDGRLKTEADSTLHDQPTKRADWLVSPWLVGGLVVVAVGFLWWKYRAKVV